MKVVGNHSIKTIVAGNILRKYKCFDLARAKLGIKLQETKKLQKKGSISSKMKKTSAGLL
jgi:hypothetical protein